MSTNEASRFLSTDSVMDNNPCDTYRWRFRDRFAERGIVVTVDLAVQQAADWDWFWAAEHLLSNKGYWAWRDLNDGFEAEYESTMQPYHDVAEPAYTRAGSVYRDRLDELEGNPKRWELANEAYAYELEVVQAALEAARGVASKRQEIARAKAFAEIFIAEGAPKAEQEIESTDIRNDPNYCHFCGLVHGVNN